MTADFDNETHDPRVAERFAELDRLEPPELFVQAAASPRVTGPVPPRRRPVDTWVLAAAAATIAFLGLFAVFVGVWDGDGTESVAADGDLADRDEVDLEEGATGEASTEGEGGTDGVEATPSVTADSGASDTTVPTTTTTEATTTTEPPPETTATTVAETTEPEGPELQIVSGTVTEVFTDCYTHLILTEEGESVVIEPVSCDGGSWVIIDGVRIETASGFVLTDDEVFDHHIRDLQPGEVATAVAVLTDADTLDLNCDECGLSRGASGG